MQLESENAVIFANQVPLYAESIKGDGEASELDAVCVAGLFPKGLEVSSCCSPFVDKGLEFETTSLVSLSMVVEFEFSMPPAVEVSDRADSPKVTNFNAARRMLESMRTIIP